MTKRSRCIVVTMICCLLAVAASTSAEAGTGWYLMLPPIRPTQQINETAVRVVDQARKSKASPDTVENALAVAFLDLDRPLREWEQSGAFDSAHECEDYWLDAVKHATRGTFRRVQYKYAHCIASDDPRLK